MGISINNGDKIFHFSVELSVDGTVKRDVKEYKVIATKDNESYGKLIVIENYAYKILQTKNEKYSLYGIFKKVNCHECDLNLSFRLAYISGGIYTNNPNEDVAYKAIKKAMIKYVNDKYGKYGNYINLLDKI